MSDTPRDPPRGDARQNASIVVLVDQRSQVHPAPEDTIELSGGASSQRTTRQSDLAPGLAAWDTRTHEPAAANEAPPSAPPDFKPFFALVEDPVTGEYHHPEVHYVFSDDEDQGVLTHAALAAIDNDENTLQQSAGPEERVAVIDLDYDGRTVVGISSLSPEWQALRTEVWQAPGKADSRHVATDRGLMLRVSGKEARDPVKDGKKDSGNMDSLVERFSRGLGSLDEVLGEGGDKGHEEAAPQSRSQRPGSMVV